jgi:hypothetical protein
VSTGTGQHLVDIHAHLRSELEQISDLVDQVALGRLSVGDARSAVNQMSLRQNDWTLGAYCASYCRVLTTHHTIEDQSVFPHLRRAEPSLAPVLDKLEADHHLVHGLLEALDRSLVGLLSGDDVDGVRDAVDRLRTLLVEHLDLEEEQLVGPLDRLGFY